MVRPAKNGANLEQSPPPVHIEKTEVITNIYSSFDLKEPPNNGLGYNKSRQQSVGGSIVVTLNSS